MQNACGGNFRLHYLKLFSAEIFKRDGILWNRQNLSEVLQSIWITVAKVVDCFFRKPYLEEIRTGETEMWKQLQADEVHGDSGVMYVVDEAGEPHLYTDCTLRGGQAQITGNGGEVEVFAGCLGPSDR